MEYLDYYATDDYYGCGFTTEHQPKKWFSHEYLNVFINYRYNILVMKKKVKIYSDFHRQTDTYRADTNFIHLVSISGRCISCSTCFNFILNALYHLCRETEESKDYLDESCWHNIFPIYTINMSVIHFMQLLRMNN